MDVRRVLVGCARGGLLRRGRRAGRVGGRDRKCCRRLEQLRLCARPSPARRGGRRQDWYGSRRCLAPGPAPRRPRPARYDGRLALVRLASGSRSFHVVVFSRCATARPAHPRPTSLEGRKASLVCRRGGGRSLQSRCGAQSGTPPRQARPFGAAAMLNGRQIPLLKVRFFRDHARSCPRQAGLGPAPHFAHQSQRRPCSARGRSSAGGARHE